MSSPDPTIELDGQLHSRLSRLLTGALVAISRTSTVAVALAGALGAADLLTPSVLAGTLLTCSLLPAAAAWLVERAAAARVTIRDDALILRRADLRVDVPRAELARVVPWSVPLPGPGASLVLHSGSRLPHEIETADPGRLLAALGEMDAGGHPIVAWASARVAAPPWRWYHLLWKFVGFALVPTAVVFNAHQHIAYGGTWGQYYLEGPAAYVRTFAMYWLTAAVYLVLWASVWRAIGEAVALTAAAIVPSRAPGVRRAVEATCRVVFYAGVPALLAIRFLV